MQEYPRTRLPWIGWLISAAVLLLLGLAGWLGFQQNRLIDTVSHSSSVGLDVWDVSQLQRQILIFESEISWALASGRIRDRREIELKWDLVWSRWDIVAQGATGRALKKIPSQLNQLPRVERLIQEIDPLIPRLFENPGETAADIHRRLREAIRLTQETYSLVYNEALVVLIRTQETLKNIQIGTAAIAVLSVVLVGVLLWITWKNQRSQLREVLNLVEELRHSEERFQNLEQGSIQGILVHRDGKPLFANQTFADIFGYATPEDILAHSSLDAFNAGDEGRKLGQYGLARLGEERRKVQYEFRGLRNNGDAICLENWDRRVTWEGGTAIQSTMVDITERKKSENELSKAKEKAENANQIKDKFVSLVAHDLRAPISSIKLMEEASMLESNSGTLQKGDGFREAIQAKCDGMLKMIDDLLKISRLQGGSISPEMRFCSASEFFPALVEMKFLAERKKVRLDSDLPDDLRLYVDVSLFREVLHNLVDNAIKFSARGGTVRIGAMKGPPPTIYVEDFGSGIPAEFQTDLFRYDVKTTSTGSGGESGTGLGLPLCSDIMQALGGKLRFETREGEGTRIFAEMQNMQPVVLVLDTEEKSLGALRKMLQPVGVEVRPAHSLEVALGLMEESPPHLAIVDLPLAIQNDFRLLRKIRDFAQGREIPVILVAQEAGGNVLEEALRLGADDFVRKPVTPEDLILRVRRFLG